MLHVKHSCSCFPLTKEVKLYYSEGAKNAERHPQTLTNKPHFPYSATSSRGVASFLLFWRNNAHSQEKWIHFCSQVSIFIYICTEILGTSDLALPSASSSGQRDERDLTLYLFVYFSQQPPPTETALLLWLWNYNFEVLPSTLDWLTPEWPQKNENNEIKRRFDSDRRVMNMWQGLNQRGTVVSLCGLWQ